MKFRFTIDPAEAVLGVLAALTLVAIFAVYWDPTRAVLREAGYDCLNVANHLEVRRAISAYCGKDLAINIGFIRGEAGRIDAVAQLDGEIIWVCSNENLAELLAEEIRLDMRDSDDTALIVQQALMVQ